eukprot:1262370-Prymnesium_polylepis.1
MLECAPNVSAAVTRAVASPRGREGSTWSALDVSPASITPSPLDDNTENVYSRGKSSGSSMKPMARRVTGSPKVELTGVAAAEPPKGGRFTDTASCAVPLLPVGWSSTLSTSVKSLPPGKLLGSTTSCGYPGLEARAVTIVSETPRAFAHNEGAMAQVKSAEQLLVVRAVESSMPEHGPAD